MVKKMVMLVLMMMRMVKVVMLVSMGNLLILKEFFSEFLRKHEIKFLSK